jgi:hypothetical protein
MARCGRDNQLIFHKRHSGREWIGEPGDLVLLCVTALIVYIRMAGISERPKPFDPIGERS